MLDYKHEDFPMKVLCVGRQCKSHQGMVEPNTKNENYDTERKLHWIPTTASHKQYQKLMKMLVKLKSPLRQEIISSWIAELFKQKDFQPLDFQENRLAELTVY